MIYYVYVNRAWFLKPNVKLILRNRFDRTVLRYTTPLIVNSDVVYRFALLFCLFGHLNAVTATFRR